MAQQLFTSVATVKHVTQVRLEELHQGNPTGPMYRVTTYFDDTTTDGFTYTTYAEAMAFANDRLTNTTVSFANTNFFGTITVAP